MVYREYLRNTKIQIRQCVPAYAYGKVLQETGPEVSIEQIGYLMTTAISNTLTSNGRRALSQAQYHEVRMAIEGVLTVTADEVSK